MLLITFSAVLNAYAKDLFQSPRPPLAIRLDDLVGALFGAATLAGFALIKDRGWFWQTDPVWSIVLVLLVTTATLTAWPGTSIAPGYVPMLAGWITGGIAGLHYEERVLGFAVAPLWSRKALAAILGILGFVALQMILKIPDASSSLPPFVWEAAKGLISGLVIALPMPWLLAKLQLVSVRKQSAVDSCTRPAATG